MRGDIAGNLQGRMSPVIGNSLTQAGLGGARLGNDVFSSAKALGKPILSLQNRGRGYFAKEIANNPERQIGLTGQDIAHISIANTGSSNNFNQGIFGNRLSQFNQQQAASADNTSALISGLGGILKSGVGLYQQATSIDPNYYQSSGQPYAQMQGGAGVG